MQRCGTRRRDRGAAAVETALVLPVLLILVFGIIDFGRMINYQIKVTEAAREGARARSISSDAASRVYQVMGGSDGVVINAGQPCDAFDTDGDAVVSVTYSFTFVTPFAVLAEISDEGYSLSATGVMPCYG